MKGLNLLRLEQLILGWTDNRNVSHSQVDTEGRCNLYRENAFVRETDNDITAYSCGPLNISSKHPLLKIFLISVMGTTFIRKFANCTIVYDNTISGLLFSITILLFQAIVTSLLVATTNYLYLK